jgi:hypothetical protein
MQNPGFNGLPRKGLSLRSLRHKDYKEDANPTDSGRPQMREKQQGKTELTTLWVLSANASCHFSFQCLLALSYSAFGFRASFGFRRAPFDLSDWRAPILDLSFHCRSAGLHVFIPS